jgi:hypothetical protein
MSKVKISSNITTYKTDFVKKDYNFEFPPRPTGFSEKWFTAKEQNLKDKKELFWASIPTAEFEDDDGYTFEDLDWNDDIAHEAYLIDCEISDFFKLKASYGY